MADFEHALRPPVLAGEPAAAALSGWPAAARRLFGFGRADPFAPAGIGKPPRLMLPGDASIGRAILRGEFSLAGATVTAGTGGIFRSAAPSEDWREALVELRWLPHLHATQLELARITARALLLQWQSAVMPGLSQRQSAMALIELAAHAEFLAGGVMAEFGRSFSSIVSVLSRRMQRGWPSEPATVLLKAVALAHACLAFRLPQATRDSALACVARVIDKVILPDGGHASRSPAGLVGLARQLIPLREALHQQHIAVPQPLNAALERLLPMLRLLCHGDDALAGFQDGSTVCRDSLRSVLSADSSRGRPLVLASQAGFGRLAYQGGALIMDVAQGGACRSALAFEFSHAAQRIIVSCGRPMAASHPWREALAAAAAHSCWDMPGSFQALRPSTSAESISSPQGGLLRARMQVADGRRRASHSRSLFLASTGQDLRGEDNIVVDGARAGECLLRFHLHPAVRPEPAPHPNCISLSLPDGAVWMFSQAGASMALEDSVYFETSLKPQASRQIVLQGPKVGGLDVQWSLRRVPRAAGLDSSRKPHARA